MTRLPVNRICTDRGQRRRRDLAFMTEVGADYPMKRDPVFNGSSFVASPSPPAAGRGRPPRGTASGTRRGG